jgi:hypothetical protein
MHSEHLGITMLHRRDLLVGLGAVTVIAAKPDLLFAEATSSQDPGFYGWSSDRPAPVTASFYVSPEGEDAWAGTFARPFRTIQAGIDHLARSGAGSLAIRGGLYRESLRLGNLAGKKTAPILIHRYGDERVRVTAADVLSGWRACSDEDVKDLGISAAGLFVCNLALADLQHGSAFALNLHEDGLWSSIATERANMTDLESASDDNRFFTAEVPLHDAGRLLGFRDSRLKGLSAGLMKDVRVLVYHAPNFVSATSIAAFSGDTGTVMLANQKLKVQKENRQPVVRYALQNIATGLGPGRWMSRIHQDGNSLTLYYRPRDAENLASRVEISTRTTCLDVESAAQVQFLGLEFIRAAGEKLGHGSAVTCKLRVPNARPARDLTFANCRVGETLSAASRGEGAVLLRGVKGLTLKNVTLQSVRGAFGLALHDCTDLDLRNLHLKGISQSAARFFGVRRCIFAFSLIEDSAREAHANKFNFYEGSDTILVYGIRTRNSGGYVTYQKASRIYFGFCAFDATADGSDNRALVSQNHPSGSGEPVQGGTFWYWNLDLMPHPKPGPPRALLLGPGRSTQRHRIHNCRLYGGGVADIYLKGASPDIETRSHNIYTGLSYWQSGRYHWTLGDHEALAPTSASAIGKDLRTSIAASIAPEFPTFADWDRDIDFNLIDWSEPPVGSKRV